MPWSGSAGSQTFTRTNGFNTGTTAWQTDDANGVDIVSSRHDTHDQDIADGLNSALKKDGGNTATANLPMGGFVHSNVGAATARTNYARFSDMQDGKGVYCPTVGGTANAIVLTTGYSLAAYAAGQTFSFIAGFSNSSAATVNIDSVGVVNITSPSAVALSAGQIVAGALVVIRYDGTQFQLEISAATPVGLSVGTVMGWPMTTVPGGWLECDGSAVSRSTYAALFAALSTSYGIGDGSTTFNLPNYKDYFLRGFDASGTDAASRTDRGDGTTGANVGTKQAGGVESHTHIATSTSVVTDSGHTHNLPGNSGAGGAATLNAVNINALNDRNVTSGSSTTGVTVATTTTNATTGGTDTRPKNVTVKWIILASVANTVPVGTGFTVSPRTMHTGGLPARVSTDGTDATPSVTETYICEVFVPGNCTATGIAVFNGSAVVGNIAVAIANSSGGVVASSASTAQAGTDAYQRVPFSVTASLYGPATYYVLLQHNNTGNRFNTHVFGNFGASKKTGEVFATFTTITPPTTFTTALGPIASLY